MKKRERFSDDGWAVWVTGEEKTNLYLNHWINPSGKSYVDVSFSIKNIGDARELNLFVPFPLEMEEITDLSDYYRDENVFRVIFGSRCIMDYMKNPYTSEIAFHGKTIDLIHFSKLDYSTKPFSGGTLVSASIGKIQDFIDNDEALICIRIPQKNLDCMFAPSVNIKSIPAKIIEALTSPVTSEKYACSIRVNETRLLPDEINHIGKFHREKLNKATVKISINDDYEVNDSGCYRIHRPEGELYGDYIPEGFNCDDAITYEWNSSIEENHYGNFNFFFRIKRESVSRISIVIYLIILLIIGILQEGAFAIVEHLLGL